MLQEAMEVFQIILQEKGERIITDAYIPKDGTYRLIVMKDDGWVIKDPVDIIFNKKTNTVDISKALVSWLFRIIPRPCITKAESIWPPSPPGRRRKSRLPVLWSPTCVRPIH